MSLIQSPSQELPDSMAGLEQLKIINTNQNDMREIGDYIEGLKSLTSFEGTHNKLEIISKHLGSLCNLRRLSILVNQVKVSILIAMMIEH